MEIERQLQNAFPISDLTPQKPFALPSQLICCGQFLFHFILPSLLRYCRGYHISHTTMPTPNSTGPRRLRQNTDEASPQARHTTLARTHRSRTRRPSFRRQHQQTRHQLPEEDRFLELRRSARIARLHQAQQQERDPTSTMADVARRTCARNDHGPRNVE
jgi:hypothetical protein